ncbi:hypothetical protein [Phenylobacterium sp.]|uniref:hypothetical protein n=1 Tax=Phenylobacterium sp. TaxID=1871053 RepID=UPI002F405E28
MDAPTAVVLLSLLAAGGAVAGEYRAPRNAFGAPELDGVWTDLSLTELQRPEDLKALVPTPAEAAAFERLQNDPDALEAKAAAERKKAGKPPLPDVGQDQSEYPDPDQKLARVRGEPRSSFLVQPSDGKLPYTPAARAWIRARTQAGNRNFDDPETRPLNERCLANLASGPPILNPGFNAHLQIVQTRDDIAILAEMTHDVRIIHMARATPPAAAVPAWMGRSTGHWVGESLIVETTGFNPREFPRGGVVLSDQAQVEERFTRTGPKTILYEFTVADPANYTQPWKGEMELTAAPANSLLEYACHEGNYALQGILAGARKAEAEGRVPEPLDGGD